MTGKSSKHHLFLTAITVLYLVNVIYGIVQWAEINLLIGTSGQSITEIVLTLDSSTFSSSTVLNDITGYLPVIITDGLLVRYIWHHFGCL